MSEKDEKTGYGTTRLTSSTPLARLLCRVNLSWSPLFILVLFFCKCSELETSAVEDEENKMEGKGHRMVFLP